MLLTCKYRFIYLFIHVFLQKALLFLSDHIFLLLQVMLNFERENISWMLEKNIQNVDISYKVLVNNLNIETEIPNKGTKSGVYVN